MKYRGSERVFVIVVGLALVVLGSVPTQADKSQNQGTAQVPVLGSAQSDNSPVTGQNNSSPVPQQSDNTPAPQRNNSPGLKAYMQEAGPSHGHMSDDNPGRGAHDFGRGGELAGIAAAVPVTVFVFDAIHHHQLVNRVKDDGPQVPKAFDMNNLHITAFVADGWPIGIEYALPGTVPARCVITASGKKASFSLPATEGRRRIVLTKIPQGFSRRTDVADYWIHLNASPLPVSKSGWPGLRIYAVAAGPRAVGSVAIDQVIFAPTDKTVHTANGDIALFGFHSHSDFDSVKAEFQVVAPNKGRNLVSTEDTMKISPVSEGELVKNQRWRPQAPPVRPGDHMVRIVAWRGVDRGADWVSAFSADLVGIEK